MVEVMKNLRFGATFGAFLYLVNWLIGFFAKGGGEPQASLAFIPTLTEGAKASIAALPTDMASRVLAWISGISNFSFTGLLTLAITGAIVAVVGAFIVDMIKGNALGKFINKSELNKIVGILIIGSIVVTALLNIFAGNPQLPALMATLTMVIYFAVFAFIYRGLQNAFPMLQKRGILILP